MSRGQIVSIDPPLRTDRRKTVILYDMIHYQVAVIIIVFSNVPLQSSKTDMHVFFRYTLSP